MNFSRIGMICLALLWMLPLGLRAHADDEWPNVSEQNEIVKQLIAELRAIRQSSKALEVGSWWAKFRKTAGFREAGLSAEIVRGVRAHLSSVASTRQELKDAEDRIASMSRDIEKMAAAGVDTTMAREEYDVRKALLASVEGDLRSYDRETMEWARKLSSTSRPVINNVVSAAGRAGHVTVLSTMAGSLLEAGMTREEIVNYLQRSVPEGHITMHATSDRVALKNPTEEQKLAFQVALDTLRAQVQEAQNRRVVERTVLENAIAVAKNRLAQLDAVHADLEANAEALAKAGDLAKIAANANAINDNAEQIAKGEIELRELQGRIVDEKGDYILGGRVAHKLKPGRVFRDLAAYVGRRNAISGHERRRLEDKLAALRDARVAIRKAGMDRHPEIDDKIAQLEERLAGAEAPTKEGDATLQAINALRSEVQRLRNDVRSLRGLVEQLLERRGARR